MPIAYDVNANPSGVGSGSQWQGSGFANFDKYLQQQNIDWGKSQSAYPDATSDLSGQNAFDNWMINTGHPGGLPPKVEDPGSAPEPAPPEILTFDKGPRLNPIDSPPPQPSYSPNPGTTWGAGGVSLKEEAPAFPTLDKKLQSGAW